jgi:uncharacterized protein DUF4258
MNPLVWVNDTLYILTDHAIDRLTGERRDIQIEWIIRTIEEPDEIGANYNDENTYDYVKFIEEVDNKLKVVVNEQELVIVTAYWI